jgi:hypothetical protein
MILQDVCRCASSRSTIQIDTGLLAPVRDESGFTMVCHRLNLICGGFPVVFKGFSLFSVLLVECRISRKPWLYSKDSGVKTRST